MTTTRHLPARKGTTTDVVRPDLPILIQVPALTTSRRGISRSKPRRRLRKEVRFAGLTMMSAVPVGLLLLTLGGARPVDRPHKPVATVAAIEREWTNAPRVSLSIEAAHPTQSERCAAPVEFSGYVLPVDGPEEPAHAGN